MHDREPISRFGSVYAIIMAVVVNGISALQYFQYGGLCVLSEKKRK